VSIGVHGGPDRLVLAWWAGRLTSGGAKDRQLRQRHCENALRDLAV